MPPVKKRRRGSEPKDEVPSKRAKEEKEVPSLSDLQQLMERAMQQVNSLSTPDAEALLPLQNDLLTLKGWQRALFCQLNGTSQALEAREHAQLKQQNSLAALQYERAHLERQIEDCKTFSTPHLEHLAKEESVDTDDKTKEQLVDDFLGANVNDPSQKQKIIARLHNELNARGGLERDLKQKEKQLDEVKQELGNKKQILDSLPDQLAVMERASKPLQKFFGSHSDSQAVRMIGTERRHRLDLAQSLPAPLFTLFQQLQQYLDLSPGDDLFLSISGEHESDMQVLLQITVPDVASGGTSSGRHKRVTIHFHYYVDQGVVTAVPRGCGSTLNQDVLLVELFPNDAPAAMESPLVGRPYHWCNTLAGLHLVSSDCLKTSTRVVLRELKQRVRANASLKFILQSLQRNTIPALPGEDKPSSDSSSVKLSSFVLDKDDMDKGDSQATYRVTISAASSRLTVQVELQMARYPVVPPKWTLNAQDDDSNALYDDGLALMERQVNVELDQFVEADREESYDWILVRQLRDIMQQWETSLGETKGGSGSRRKRGRDHVPVAES